MRVAAVLVSALVSWSLAAGPISAEPERYGYVVEIPAGTQWRVAGRAEEILIGSVLNPGDRLVTTPETTATLSVMEYATGSVVGLRSGQLVPAARSPRRSGWARLSDAIARRLSNEHLTEGVVRARPRLTDSARLTPGSHQWSSIVIDLPPGSYRARFRRLSADGTPAGEWVTSIDLNVAASGFKPATFPADLGPGLWQVSIHHRDSPSIGGEAWLLLTKDEDAVRQFDELSRLLAGFGQAGDTPAAQGTVRVRRAALLALTP